MKRHRDFVREQLAKNPKLREEYEALEPEFQFRSALIGARVDAGLTQAELAERVGTKQSAIARLEGGSAKPSFDMLRRLATALDVSFEVLPGSKVEVHQQEAVAQH